MSWVHCIFFSFSVRYPDNHRFFLESHLSTLRIQQFLVYSFPQKIEDSAVNYLHLIITRLGLLHAISSFQKMAYPPVSYSWIWNATCNVRSKTNSETLKKSENNTSVIVVFARFNCRMKQIFGF